MEAYKRAEYNKAINIFDELLKDGGDKGRLNYLIAQSYRKSNRIQSAETYYRQALEANITGAEEDTARFFYGMALKSNGKYAEAKERFTTYSKTGKSTDLIRRAKIEVDNAKKVEEILATKTYYEVKNCDAINTPSAEFAPVVFKDRMFFSSTRKDGVYEGTGSGFAGIYEFKFLDMEKCVGSANLFTESINLAGANEASPTFAHDGSYLIFARSSTGEKGESNEVDLFTSIKQGADWGEPEILPYPVNINETLLKAGNQNLNGSKGNYWTSTPDISPDGKRLYFASNRTGGYGGVDIWIGDITGVGKIRNIRNAGKDINTAGDELFPFISDDGVLYFASNGHPGLGGLDIFKAVRKDSKTTVTNMGLPVNSNADDFGWVFKDKLTGFFSSNREGGRGDDDIYQFKDVTPDRKIVNYNLRVFVVGIDPTDKDKKETPLSNANVEVFLGDEIQKGDKINTFSTNTEGKTNTFAVKQPQDYLLIANAGDDYFKKEIEYTTAGKGIPEEFLVKYVTDTTFEAKVILEKIVIIDTLVYEIEINFDFGQANIRPDAAVELDKFVIFLKDNPQINIELGSHTDAVGTAENNLALSQRRADSTVAYLIKKGIDPARMEAVGYGETRLKIQTTDAEERNRRTEFKVTKIVRRKD